MPDHLGLSKKEVSQYSLLRAIHAAANRDYSGAGLEMEASRAECQRRGLTPVSGTSIFVPNDVFTVNSARRDLTAGTASAGGYLVGTENKGFIDMLRARMVLARMGATILDGLTGNVTIPRQTGSATAYWLATEGTSATESQQTFGQISLTPKTVAAYTELSRQFTLQSTPSAEYLVRDDVAKVLGLAGDLAGIAGTGASGQPTGLLNTAGIGSVTGASVDYADMVEFQTDVAASNALAPTCGYVTTPTVAGVLKGRQRFSGTDTPLWQGSILDGEIEGFRAMTSTQVPSATMIFGDFEQIIIAEWGVLEIDINPYASFQAGIIGVRAMYSMDIGVRYPGAFSIATSVS